MGNECYKKLRTDASKCKIPCKGMYADVIRDVEDINVEDGPKFDNLFDNYEAYKRGYSIISGVEVVYFGVKIVVENVMRRMKERSQT